MNETLDDSLPSHDQPWMLEALQLAELGQGRVEPNPMVGCVLVSDGNKIGSGFHRQYGGDHAERAAVAAAVEAGFEDRISGCTAYVSLVPCCYHGKTPPSTDLLIELGVQRVVVAIQDPYSPVAGQGIQQLRQAGIKVDVGLCSSEAIEINAPYLKRTLTTRPWMIAKWAMSLDGKIATRTGHSQWISSPESRLVAHQLRSRMDAILIGSGTAIADDPLLNARLPDNQTPLRKALRVVLDSRLTINPSSKLAATANQYPTLIWTGPDAELAKAKSLQQQGCRVEVCDSSDASHRLDSLLQFLVAEYSATNVLVEGGQKLLGSLFDLRQIDECHVFLAPRLIGGQESRSPIGGVGVSSLFEGPNCYAMRHQVSGGDIYYSCRLNWTDTQSPEE